MINESIYIHTYIYILRASVRACAAGELGAALTQWPNHFNLLCCTV